MNVLSIAASSAATSVPYALRTAIFLKSTYSCAFIISINFVRLEKPTEASYVTFAFPLLPCLVVISTTPFAAREPYKAAAAASFNTSIERISAGLMSANALALPNPPPKSPD